MKRPHIWPRQQIAWLLANYHFLPVKFSAERLGRTENAVRIMASRLRQESQRIESARMLRNVSRAAIAPTRDRAAS